MSSSPGTVVKVGWVAGAAYAGSFRLDDPTRGELDGTTYTLAAELLTELPGVLNAKATSGRNGRYDAPTAGTLTVTLDDANRTLDPTNEAGPFYGAIEARRPITLSSRWVVGAYTVDVPAWFGYVEDIIGDYRIGSDRVTITAVDLIGLLNFTVSDSASLRPAESCGDRLRYLVSLLGFDVPVSVVDAGRTLVAMELDGKNVLSLIRGIELADQGRFWVTTSGSWAYTSALADDAEPLRATSTPNYVLGELPLAAAPVSSSLARYYNSVTGARVGAPPLTIADVDGVARFGRREPSSITELPLSDDTEVADVLGVMLARANNRTPMPKSATVHMHAIAASPGGSIGSAMNASYVTQTALTRTLAVVTMHRTGYPLDVTSVGIIDRITHDSSPARWTTTFDLSPIPAGIAPLELDDGTLAVLDTARLGF